MTATSIDRVVILDDDAPIVDFSAETSGDYTIVEVTPTGLLDGDEHVGSLGGTISAEHGIGQLKRVELGQRQSATRTAWMRAIKHALDPEQRFNPGRLVP